MRLNLELDHLVVAPAEQHARHREYLRRMYSPPVAPARVEAKPIAPEPEPEPEPEPMVRRWRVPLGWGGVRARFDSDEERICWMKAEYDARPAGRQNRVVFAQALGAQAFGVSVCELQSDRKTHLLSQCRMKTIAFCRVVITGVSLRCIGFHFGGRDHSTVVYASKKYGDLVTRALGNNHEQT